jgi:hypothetical protein
VAISSVITKKSVSSVGEGSYLINVNLKYQDGATVLLDLDFSEKFKTGQAYSTVFFNLKERMKAAIRHHKEEQAIFTAAALDTVITNLNSTVGV